MLLGLGLLLPVALAHRPGLSYGDLEPDRVSLTFSREELAARFPADRVEEARDLLAAATLDQLRISVGGQPCVVGAPEIAQVSGGETAAGADPAALDGVRLSAPLSCPGSGEGSYEAGFLSTMEAGHRHLLTFRGEPVAVLDRDNASASFQGPSHPGEVALRFLKLGVEHILTGYDHLLFLLGLLLVADRLRAMLLVVTGFTLAHSITLSAAALDLVTLSPALVEPAIAATIIFVGVENLWRPSARRRMALTFALGLIHGFGFAGLLREIGLPHDALVTALLCFNGGVELGQAAIVALALPLLLWLRRFPAWERRGVPALSIGVALAGLWWLLQRTVLA